MQSGKPRLAHDRRATHAGLVGTSDHDEAPAMTVGSGGVRPPRRCSKWECERCGAVSPPPHSDDGLCAWCRLQANAGAGRAENGAASHGARRTKGQRVLT